MTVVELGLRLIHLGCNPYCLDIMNLTNVFKMRFVSATLYMNYSRSVLKLIPAKPPT